MVGRPSQIDVGQVAADVAAGMKTSDVAARHGCSVRRVQQICAEQGITANPRDPEQAAVGLPNRPHVPLMHLAVIVFHVINAMGHHYGIRPIVDAVQALLPAYHVTRSSVSRVMLAVFPNQYAARMLHARRRLIRGQTYHAPYCGYSLHIDANCKLQEYGVHIMGAQDGKSRRIVALRAVTDMLMVTCYRECFQPAVAALGGLWDQTLSDKGSENLLFAFVCHHLHTARISRPARQA